MATLKTYAWDASDHLKTKADIAAYLEAALAEGNPSLVAAALGDIARSQGMTHMVTK
jgi:probable addiction module antidote protein